MNENLLSFSLGIFGERTVDWAFLERIMRSIRSCMMDDVMQGLPLQFLEGIAGKIFSGRIRVDAELPFIHEKHSHAGIVEHGIKPSTNVPECLFGLFAFLDFSLSCPIKTRIVDSHGSLCG